MPQEALTYFQAGEKKFRMRYLRFLPEGVGEDLKRKWPLILFMHGAGERGHDPDILKRHGIRRFSHSQSV